MDFDPGEVRLTLNFADPNFTPSATNPYWGMRWLGNFVTTLSNFVNEAGSGFTGGDGRIDVNIVGGSNLQWSDFNIGTYVDGANTYTYIGFTNWEAPLAATPNPARSSCCWSAADCSSAVALRAMADKAGGRAGNASEQHER